LLLLPSCPTRRSSNLYLKDKKIAMMRGYYLTKFVETPWYRDMAKSGGQLVEQSTHIVDMLRYFAGDVEKVSADMNLLVSQDIPRSEEHTSELKSRFDL